MDDDVGHPEILIMNIITILTKRALRDLSFQTISNFFIKKDWTYFCESYLVMISLEN